MKAYCQNCASIQPSSFRPESDVATGEHYEDLCCDTCHFVVATVQERATHPQATEPAPKKLIGWRTADYLRETTDRHMAKNWEVHYEVLPIFEGDANTKLAAAPEAHHE